MTSLFLHTHRASFSKNEDILTYPFHCRSPQGSKYWISSSTPSSFKSRCKRKKQKLHSFIVASFNAQSVKGNDMACKRCEISTFIKDNGVDLFFVTDSWLSAQGDEAKTAELAPSGFDVKSFPRHAISWRWNCYSIQIYFRL